jgi:hypothetical protein
MLNRIIKLNSIELNRYEKIEEFYNIKRKIAEKHKYSCGKYNLSKFELTILNCYTGSFSSCINKPLRKNQLIDGIHEKTVIRLEEILNKIPQVESKYVYRMDNSSIHLDINLNEYLNWFNNRIGKIIKIPFFQSTSLIKWEDYPIYWKIKPLKTESKCKKLNFLKLENNENEVLFNRNSFLKIISLSGNTIQFEEVRECNDYICFVDYVTQNKNN